jgi:penicillin amidase
VVTANNPWVGPAYPHFLGRSYVAGYRARRITELVKQAIGAGSVDIAGMTRIQLDDRDESVAEVLPHLTAIPPDLYRTLLKSALPTNTGERANPLRVDDLLAAVPLGLTLLAEWDRRMTGGSAAAALYAELTVQLAHRTYQDEFEPVYWEKGLVLKSTPRVQSSLDLLLQEPRNPWWDNRHTADHVETRDEILVLALAEAVLRVREELGSDPRRWAWRDRHSLTYTHQTLGRSGVAPVEWIFNRGPYHTDSGLNQVNRHAVRLYEPDQVVYAGALRMIHDVSDWSLGLYAATSGQSGHIRSPHYDDAIEDWVEGRYSSRPWTEAEVKAIRGPRMTLTPSVSQ